MLESVIGGIAVPIFEQLWKAGGYAIGQVHAAKQNVRSVEDVINASQEYHRKYRERHGQVKVMPGLMKEPAPLESIYTAIKFLNESSIRQFDGPDELEKLYRDQDNRRFQTGNQRHDGITIAQEKQYLMVLGGPGIGKSTFLKKLGLEALKGNLHGTQIPVLIELKTFRNNKINLVTAIAKEFEICGFPDPEAFTALSLSQGRLLLLLDGLDEVPTRNMNHVIEQIEAFTIQFDRNTFVASCRTAAYRSSFKQFTDVTIADFDDAQIEQFVQRWFNSVLDQKADTAKQYWQLLQQPENKAAKELAQTPLLLTFLCLIYEREQALPNRRSTLYGRALNILLSEWSAQKRLEQTPIYKDFHPELEKELLSEIAFSSFAEDRLFFSKSDITDRITHFLADTLDAPEHLNGQDVLQAIEVQQGILVERAIDTYSFSHLTLQEYLAALHIVNNQLITEVVSQHLTDQRWREVFLLVIGLMGRRGHELLDIIDQQARTYINEQPKILYLIQWANKMTQGSRTTYKSFVKRAIAIAIVIDITLAPTHSDARVHARELVINSTLGKVNVDTCDRITSSACALVNDIDTTYVIAKDIAEDIIAKNHDDARARAKALISDLTSAIEFANYLAQLTIFSTSAFSDLCNHLQILRKKMPLLSASADEWLRYAGELEASWPKYLGLTVDTTSRSAEEWKCLSNYVYANELLLSCQRSSISLSRKAWDVLEARLLTIE